MNIIEKSIASTTRKSYDNVWKRLVEFCRKIALPVSLPLPPPLVVNFLCSQFELGLAPSTIAAQASAISYFHKIHSVPDPNASFLVKCFLKGVSESNHGGDIRKPITIDILNKMLEVTPLVVSNHVQSCLISSVFSLCFQAFLRMGEVCVQAGREVSKVIQREHVKFKDSQSQGCMLELTLHHYKHKADSKPTVIIILSNRANHSRCAVALLLRYLQHFPAKSGPLFQWHNGSPVTYRYMAGILARIVTFLGYDTRLFKPHSFRIGAATTAFMQGMSEEEIQRLGRWKSNAVSNYIRVPSFTVRPQS